MRAFRWTTERRASLLSCALKSPLSREGLCDIGARLFCECSRLYLFWVLSRHLEFDEVVAGWMFPALMSFSGNAIGWMFGSSIVMNVVAVLAPDAAWSIRLSNIGQVMYAMLLLEVLQRVVLFQSRKGRL
jgi:hypothetical protein